MWQPFITRSNASADSFPPADLPQLMQSPQTPAPESSDWSRKMRCCERRRSCTLDTSSNTLVRHPLGNPASTANRVGQNSVGVDISMVDTQSVAFRAYHADQRHREYRTRPRQADILCLPARIMASAQLISSQPVDHFAVRSGLRVYATSSRAPWHAWPQTSFLSGDAQSAKAHSTSSWCSASATSLSLFPSRSCLCIFLPQNLL